MTVLIQMMMRAPKVVLIQVMMRAPRVVLKVVLMVAPRVVPKTEPPMAGLMTLRLLIPEKSRPVRMTLGPMPKLSRPTMMRPETAGIPAILGAMPRPTRAATTVVMAVPMMTKMGLLMTAPGRAIKANRMIRPPRRLAVSAATRAVRIPSRWPRMTGTIERPGV
jgi:hypothetical protein